MGYCEIRYTRRYDASPNEVWAALTEPASVARWLGDFPTRVREAEPPRLLEWDWEPPGDEPSVVRFELTAQGDGTVLVLDHRRINAVAGMGYMERWLPTLELLDQVLAQ